MYSRVILISILAALVGNNVSASILPIGSSEIAPSIHSRDNPVSVVDDINKKRAENDNGKDGNVSKGKDNASASGAGNKFGKCKPNLIFEGGLGNRKADEFTFQSGDPICSEDQGEALNPNIITNHIKDVVNTRCDATPEGKAAVASAIIIVQGLKVRDQSVADKWNAALGLN